MNDQSAVSEIPDPPAAHVDLTRLEQSFRALCNFLPAGIYLTDKFGHCIYMNRRWCAMAGMPPETRNSA